MVRTAASASPHPRPGPRRWWTRLFAWLRTLFTARRARALLPRPAPGGRWGPQAASLPEDLRAQLASLRIESGAVRDAVAGAIEDYVHLRDVLLGPGASGSPLDDTALLAEAEVTLRSLIGRASAVAALVSIAARRRADRAGRAATGDAMLLLRDQARSLSDTASAALRFAASGDPKDADRLCACADTMQQVTARAERSAPTR